MGKPNTYGTCGTCGGSGGGDEAHLVCRSCNGSGLDLDADVLTEATEDDLEDFAEQQHRALAEDK